MSNYRILLCDDDEILRGILAQQLRFHEEFIVSEAGTAMQALELAKNENFDLIILDIGLPDLDGHELCRMMRKINITAPIIMLTANISESDTILGLDAGANDYVTKPFKFGVLLARIRAHLRQYSQRTDASFTVGPYLFKPAEKCLTHRNTGDKITLTEKENNIIKFLQKAGGKPVTCEILLGEIWGYNHQISTHTLETHIYRLRQKIEEIPKDAKIIITEAGGYRIDTSPLAP